MAKNMTFCLHVLLVCAALVTNALTLIISRDPTGYAPTPVQCPSFPLTRAAKYTGDISVEEKGYFQSRKPVAQQALKAWFEKIGRDAGISFDVECESELPVIALAVSGGGDRSAVTAAGVVKSLDAREQVQTSMSGLYQAFTYHSALSGGNELSGSLERLNWPTITYVLQNLWYTSLTRPRIYPGGNKNNSKPAYQQIETELKAKHDAGFKVSIVDILGRLYAYAYLGPPAGSPNFLMSDITTLSNFTSHMVPYPIHETVNEAEYGLGCSNDNPNNTNFEMTPFEFGSWDPGVSSFSRTKYLGSMPASKNLTCVNGFDRLGFMLDTSGDAAGTTCQSEQTIATLENLTDYKFAITQETFRAQYPNPFYGNSIAPAIQNFDYLQLVDGGGSNMGVAVWPLIHRPSIDVVFLSDNTNSTQNGTNGEKLYNTYVQAQKEGLTLMPMIPTPQEFMQYGYDKRNVFFGCNNNASQSIVYMPDRDITFDSVSVVTSLQEGLTVPEINSLVSNGELIGTNNNAANFPVCVGCLILKKTNTQLPSQCQSCFEQYCIT